MLEREAELEQLSRMVARARDGTGGLAVVEGPAGIGKTRLLHAVRELGVDDGVTTLTARGGPLEGDFAFGIVRQLLGPRSIAAAAPAEGLAGEALTALGLLVGGAGEQRLRRVDSASAEGGAAAIVQGVYWALAALAEREPLMVVIDDAQWADAPSWRLVAYLARRLDDLAISVVLGSRYQRPAAAVLRRPAGLD